MTRRQPYHFTIQTSEGYSGEYATKEEAEHARRRLFGVRALAHPIVRVATALQPRKANR